jgi:hypothetical protein
VIERYALYDANDADDEPECGRLMQWAGTQGPGRVYVAARRPEAATFDFATARTAWPADTQRPGEVLLTKAGTARGTVTVSGGRYQPWLEGSFGRALELRIDGRKVGSAEGINTPGGWLRAGGEIRLAPGRHDVEVRWPSPGLAPGDGARSSLGAVALVAPGEVELERVAPQEADRLCGRQWDWIDLVTADGT